MSASVADDIPTHIFPSSQTAERCVYSLQHVWHLLRTGLPGTTFDATLPLTTWTSLEHVYRHVRIRATVCPARFMKPWTTSFVSLSHSLRPSDILRNHHDRGLYTTAMVTD